MKNWFLRLISIVVVVVAIFAGVFWFRLTAEEAAVELAKLPSQGIQGGSRGSGKLAADIPTLDPTATPQSTFTPIPTLTNTPPAGASLTATSQPTVGTVGPKGTPTSIPLPDVEIAEFEGEYPPPEGVATPVEIIDMPSGVTNILLIGNDTPSDGGSLETVRTDSLMIVSINRELATASILSIPRDLYVFIPAWRDGRINTAFARGERVGYPGGGPKQLMDTILYNFGIPVHYYARIDFSGFEGAVDSIGGIEIVNSCSLTDWILKEPGLDITVEENYEQFTLEPGIHQMDGFTALWYARSRRTTSDFDRGRRQQQIMSAILSKGLDLNLLSQAPAMWESFQETIETDMDFGKALQLAALAPSIQENGIQHLSLTRGEIQGHTILESGANVSLLVPDEARKTLSRLYDVSGLNRSTRSPITVELVNGSSNPDLPYIVASTLEWFGIASVISEEVPQNDSSDISSVEIEYFGQNFKGSYNWLVSWVFNVGRSEIELSDEKSDISYRVVLKDG
ncbi:MAG: LCP family protein required for cell wall assembly, partial [Cellvibrionaceae bacterium]